MSFQTLGVPLSCPQGRGALRKLAARYFALDGCLQLREGVTRRTPGTARTSMCCSICPISDWKGCPLGSMATGPPDPFLFRWSLAAK